MRYSQDMENGVRPPYQGLDRAHTVCGNRLVETTPEVNREVAESAMLLSQGARRAIEMKRDADNASTDPAVPAIPAAADARPS
jgi:hypothetical protein